MMIPAKLTVYMKYYELEPSSWGPKALQTPPYVMGTPWNGR